jgi:peptide/nickel transport system substrate-binding protein
MEALINGARDAAAVGDNTKYATDVEGFISLAYQDVPRVPLFQPYLNVATQPNIAGYCYWFHRQVDYRSIVKT